MAGTTHFAGSVASRLLEVLDGEWRCGKELHERSGHVPRGSVDVALGNLFDLGLIERRYGVGYRMKAPYEYRVTDKATARNALDEAESGKGKSPWTPQLEALGARLYAEGLPCREIARRLGQGLTRNAVIGKKERRGWKRSGSTPVVDEAAPSAAPAPAIPSAPWKREPRPAWMCRDGGCTKTRLAPYEKCKEHLDKDRRHKKDSVDAEQFRRANG